MKKLILGIIILIILLGVIVLSELYQRSVLEEMLSLTAVLEDGSIGERNETVSLLGETWERGKRILSLLTHTREIEGLDLAISKLSTASRENNEYEFSLALAETTLFITEFKDGSLISALGIL